MLIFCWVVRFLKGVWEVFLLIYSVVGVVLEIGDFLILFMVVWFIGFDVYVWFLGVWLDVGEVLMVGVVWLKVGVDVG